MSESAVPVSEFFLVEFNHPTLGWTLLTDVYACRTREQAQAAIVHRVAEVPKTRRDDAHRAYRIVRYVREEPMS